MGHSGGGGLKIVNSYSVPSEINFVLFYEKSRPELSPQLIYETLARSS